MTYIIHTLPSKGEGGVVIAQKAIH